MTGDAAAFTPEERTAILQEYDRVVSQPVPVNTSSVGCAMFLIALALFIFGPFVWRRVPVLTTPFFIVEGALVLIGLFWYLRGSGGGYARASMGSEAALKVLAQPTAAVTDKLRAEAAAGLIAGAYYSHGPRTTTTFNVAASRQQLGPALPFVISVENLLIAERKASPVFTIADEVSTPPVQV
jgi:hypothetical protein